MDSPCDEDQDVFRNNTSNSLADFPFMIWYGDWYFANSEASYTPFICSKYLVSFKRSPVCSN